MKQRFIPVAVALMIGAFLAAGCSENKVPTPEDKAATEQKKIEDIKNDPNLPPAAKENIIRNMQQQQAASQAQGQASGASQADAMKARGGAGASK